MHRIHNGLQKGQKKFQIENNPLYKIEIFIQEYQFIVNLT